jgi:hypothetical protein
MTYVALRTYLLLLWKQRDDRRILDRLPIKRCRLAR